MKIASSNIHAHHAIFKLAEDSFRMLVEVFRNFIQYRTERLDGKMKRYQFGTDVSSNNVCFVAHKIFSELILEP